MGMVMRYVEATEIYDGTMPSLFLAGGINGTENWQVRMAGMLEPTEWVVLNPRRKVFPTEAGAAEEQIRWEYEHLRRATACLFWFPPETLCPIALYELGGWSRGNKPLFVGAHRDYRRLVDLRIQLSLVRPEVKVVCDLEELAAMAAGYLRNRI